MVVAIGRTPAALGVSRYAPPLRRCLFVDFDWSAIGAVLSRFCVAARAAMRRHKLPLAQGVFVGHDPLRRFPQLRAVAPLQQFHAVFAHGCHICGLFAAVRMACLAFCGMSLVAQGRMFSAFASIGLGAQGWRRERGIVAAPAKTYGRGSGRFAFVAHSYVEHHVADRRQRPRQRAHGPSRHRARRSRRACVVDKPTGAAGGSGLRRAHIRGQILRWLKGWAL